MNKENLEQGLTKLLKTFYTKKYNRDFSDLTVVLDEYEEDADDMDDEGNWVSAETELFPYLALAIPVIVGIIVVGSFERRISLWIEKHKKEA